MGYKAYRVEYRFDNGREIAEKRKDIVAESLPDAIREVYDSLLAPIKANVYQISAREISDAEVS